MTGLEAYNWQGNAREVRNVIERLLILRTGDAPIRVDELPMAVRLTSSSSGSVACPYVLPDGGADLEVVERGLIDQALSRAKGNQTQAARLLGITRHALRYRLEKHGLTSQKSLSPASSLSPVSLGI